jgi:hypothetical protein
MPQPSPADSEPTPESALLPFQEADFFALSEGLSRDAQYNEQRLALRRKLGGLAKHFVAKGSDGKARRPKLGLDSRTSLHNPHAFNGNRVRRLWTYICRDKAEKGRLKRVVGADLAKDLDASFRNAYLCVAVEAEQVEVSLKIHQDAWLDGQNLKRRVDKEGYAGLLEVLNGLDGFILKLADWKGEWRCGSLDASRLKEFFGYYEPGTHALAVERSWPAPRSQPAVREAMLGEGVPDAMLAELERLIPLYRFAAWSKASDHLFG